MAPLVSIRTTGDKIEIVDQLLLPHVVEYVEIASVHDAHAAIKSMRVRPAHYAPRGHADLAYPS